MATDNQSSKGAELLKCREVVDVSLLHKSRRQKHAQTLPQQLRPDSRCPMALRQTDRRRRLSNGPNDSMNICGRP
jgi:hypothetical protein